MRATFVLSPSETSTFFPCLRFTFGDFDERIWRTLVWPRLILPVPVFLKRFFAPVWVFNLGIFFSFALDWAWWPDRSPLRTGASLPLRGFSEYTGRPGPALVHCEQRS